MMMNKVREAIIAAACSFGIAQGYAAESVNFVSWGGSTQDAQKEAWATPFTGQTGIKVIQDGPTDYGKLKAMVESGNVQWDLVDVEVDFAYRAAKEGLLEPLDFSVIDKTNIDPRFVSDYGIGSFYFSFVLAYNMGKLSGQPANWSALFDTETFPGKRALYKWPSPGVIELALLADGVAESDLYPLDLDRAFKKLDTIKKDIIWWGGGAQSQQLLASGEVSMGQFWNGRIFALQEDGVPVGVSWKQNLVMSDFLVIPKGAKNKDAAMKFLAYSTSAQGQADFAELTAFSPINSESSALISDDLMAFMPTTYSDDQVSLDYKYWAEHGPDIAKKWNEWILK
ncbi:ABC transporter substrate-binding protein [Marinomonas mediterranea]|jgi:Spermidine/putrescine-binding periplasmic protein|uniref:Extracellular solute-binding protein family 1 n=1 Tax=Marinomonas mediterranea (strain ATCC 700492 / JCM 21426 / NBRC 103028 / MMB-1) TaxID=717774 RepID=F2JV19_MARM1|nr:ABC transporter substrate-binding protein [Marinomonas mediterranea]ADZ91673.1 extracellular solute-binding protein family 1 [Marinomonas mediterranea MMB-1]WCN17772.1 extracellular solute-binding protein [Marinomonas mediterranea MMB-1]